MNDYVLLVIPDPLPDSFLLSISRLFPVLSMPLPAFNQTLSGYTKKRISSEAKSLLAAHLFEKGVLSLGKAAELAELKLGSFIHFLDELKIPVIDYDDDELKAEFKIAKKLKEA